MFGASSQVVRLVVREGLGTSAQRVGELETAQTAFFYAALRGVRDEVLRDHALC